VVPAVLAALFVFEFHLLGTFGIDLEDDHALVRGLRRRRVHWDDVLSIETRTFAGSRTVTLVEADRRTRLRAPLTGAFQRDIAYDQKVETIREWWLNHRSPTSAPLPDVTVLQTMATHKSRSLTQNVQLFLSVILAAYVVFIVLVGSFLVVATSWLRALELTVPGLVALGIISALWPTRPRLTQWVHRHRG
jgi:hypothetical protein